ncbi:ribose-phosphate pyrophosphokinase [Listeria phage 20422-1]
MTLYMNGKKVHESTFPNGEINIMPDERRKQKLLGSTRETVQKTC